MHEITSAEKASLGGSALTEEAIKVGFDNAIDLKDSLEHVFDSSSADAQAEPGSARPEPNTTGAEVAHPNQIERPSLDSPWLDRLSDEQANIIEALDLTQEQKHFLTAAIFQTRRLLAEGWDINPSVTIAQAELESGYGTNAPGNNYFGVKVGTKTSGWHGGKQIFPKAAELDQKTGQLKTEAGVFRRYPSLEASFTDYADLIKLHYHHSAANWQNAEEYIRGLGAYATGKGYQEELRKMIREIPYAKLAAVPKIPFVP